LWSATRNAAPILYIVRERIAAWKRYHHTPGDRERRLEYNKKRRSDPEFRERKRAYMKKYQQDPEVKEQRRFRQLSRRRYLKIMENKI
jgi:hypothetical protein